MRICVVFVHLVGAPAPACGLRLHGARCVLEEPGQQVIIDRLPLPD